MTTKLKAVHPVLMVTDVEASIRFYAGLGFRETFRDSASPKYAAVRRDDVEIHLQWHDARDLSHGDRPTYRFVVDDVDALLEELTRGNPHVDRTDAWDTSWGTREFHVRDPDRNGLQFYGAR